MKNKYHHSQLWREKINVWLCEMKFVTSYDLYDRLVFKNMIFEYITKLLYKDTDDILESFLYLAKVGIEFQQSFYIVRAAEKLFVDWKHQISFLKITEILIFIKMVYVVSPQDVMDIAVILEKNFKIDSDSFDEEMHCLKLFLPVTFLAIISFENAVMEYRYLCKQIVPSRAGVTIRRKYYKIIKEMDDGIIKMGFIVKIKKTIINKINLIIKRN